MSSRRSAAQKTATTTNEGSLGPTTQGSDWGGHRHHYGRATPPASVAEESETGSMAIEQLTVTDESVPSVIDSQLTESSVLSREAIYAAIIRGTFCTMKRGLGDRQIKLKLDDTKTKITFVDFMSMKTIQLAEIMGQAVKFAWVEHTLFVVDIEQVLPGHKAPKGEFSRDQWSKSLQIHGMLANNERITLSLVFSNGVECQQWHLGLKECMRVGQPTYEVNPTRMVMEKMWLIADSSGDGRVDRKEVDDLLVRLNIKLKKEFMKTLLQKVCKCEEGQEKSVEMDRAEFEKFVWLIQNHTHVEAIWQQHVVKMKHSRMTLPLLERFLRLEQKEKIPVPPPQKGLGAAPDDAENNTPERQRLLSIVADVTGGKSYFTKKTFEAFLKQSSHNSAVSPDAMALEEAPTSFPNYYINSAHDLFHSFNHRNLQSLLHHYVVKQHVRCLTVFVKKTGAQEVQVETEVTAGASEKDRVRVVQRTGEASGVSFADFLKALRKAVSDRGHPLVYPLILHLILGDGVSGGNPTGQGEIAKALGDHLGDKILTKRYVPKTLLRSEVGLFSPYVLVMVTDPTQQTLTVEALTASRHHHKRASLAHSPSGVASPLSPFADPMSAINELKSQFHEDLLRVVHMVSMWPVTERGTQICIPSTFEKMESFLGPDPPKRGGQGHLDEDEENQKHFQILETQYIELGVVPVLRLRPEEVSMLHKLGAAAPTPAAKDGAGEPSPRSLVGGGGGYGEDGGSDASGESEAQGPQPVVKPLTLKELTRWHLVYSRLPPMFDSVGNPASQIPSSYYSAGVPWSCGVQMVSIRHGDHRRPDLREFSPFQSVFRMDNSWLLQSTRFALNGGVGWVRKPFLLTDAGLGHSLEKQDPLKPYVRQDEGPCTVILKVISGQMLPEGRQEGAHGVKEAVQKAKKILSAFVHRHAAIPDPFIDIRIDGVPADYAAAAKSDDIALGKPGEVCPYLRTRDVSDNGFCPMWDERFEIPIQSKEHAFLTFTAWDKSSSGNHQFLCEGCIPLAQSRLGLRNVFMRDADGRPFPTSPSLLISVQETREGDPVQLAEELNQMDKRDMLLQQQLRDLTQAVGAQRDKVREKTRAFAKDKRAAQELHDNIRNVKDKRLCYCGWTDDVSCSIQ